MRWFRAHHNQLVAPPPEAVLDRLEVLDGDDPAIVGRPERWPQPTAREQAYAGPQPDPGGSAGLWSAIEHL